MIIPLQAQVECGIGICGRSMYVFINPENGNNTHMVMHQGQLWRKKDAIIQLSTLGKTSEETIFLNLDKHQIESLADLPADLVLDLF